MLRDSSEVTESGSCKAPSLIPRDTRHYLTLFLTGKNIYLCVFVSVCVYIYPCMCVSVSARVCMFTGLGASVSVCTCVCVHMRANAGR